MRLSRPSPAMIVALVALVFAMTGTGIAAKTALIDGARIKNKSISGKKLAAHSITPKGYGLIAVKLPAAKKSSAHSSQSAADQSKEITTADAAATLLIPSNTFDTTAMSQALSQNGIDTTVTGPPGPPGAAGAAGADAGASLAARASVTGNPPANFSKFMAVTGNPAKVDDQPYKVSTVMPAVPLRAGQVTAAVIGTWPSRASSIVVSLLVNDVGVSVTSLGCTLTAAQPQCTAPGPVDIPASSRLAWSAQVITTPVVPPAIPTQVEDFDLSVSAQSQQR